jgi:hypothetical protein
MRIKFPCLRICAYNMCSSLAASCACRWTRHCPTVHFAFRGNYPTKPLLQPAENRTTSTPRIRRCNGRFPGHSCETCLSLMHPSGAEAIDPLSRGPRSLLGGCHFSTHPRTRLADPLPAHVPNVPLSRTSPYSRAPAQGSSRRTRGPTSPRRYSRSCFPASETDALKEAVASVARPRCRNPSIPRSRRSSD